ncbi:hypothetical protein FBEOM_6998 [Fusarium beomiforme]|uniref:Uncharacterized protein n=1 Tax=Fusarium beomiforme TaxID=44412 RepID=A0A9P5DYK1_9HYPO|nr:hypothetical protein FBEOM_6998 [Fusarium beomiforme]
MHPSNFSLLSNFFYPDQAPPPEECQSERNTEPGMTGQHLTWRDCEEYSEPASRMAEQRKPEPLQDQDVDTSEQKFPKDRKQPVSSVSSGNSVKNDCQPHPLA